MNKKSIVLDVGSGIGHHINEFKSKNINVIGLETSKAMIKKCKTKFKGIKPDIKYGNAMDSMIFEGDQFTHILCLFYTFYYMPSPEGFLRNANKWLRHNGYLVIHIVDDKLFHPIVPPSEIFNIPSVYAKKGRRYESIVKFKTFDYKSNLNKKENAYLTVFTDKDSGSIRQNVHKLLMYTKRIAERCLNLLVLKLKR